MHVQLRPQAPSNETRLGIASFAMAILALVTIIGSMVAFTVNSPVLLGYSYALGVLFCLVGLVLGMIGMMKRNRGVFTKRGFIFNFAMFLGGAGLLIFANLGLR